MIGRFRKKPVVIEAIQLKFGGNYREILEWISNNGGSAMLHTKPPFRSVSGIIIRTKEGNMLAGFGDWIIKGVQGEFYPCKPDIFEATYDQVEDDK